MLSKNAKTVNSNFDTWSARGVSPTTKKANKSDQLSVTRTRDTTIQLVEKKSSDDSKQIHVMFETALLLR